MLNFVFRKVPQEFFDSAAGRAAGPKLVYLLYDYGEHGPESLIADTDPSRFRARAEAWLTRPDCYGPDRADAALARVEAALAAGPGRHPLARGWGAPVVEIVPVPEGT